MISKLIFYLSWTNNCLKIFVYQRVVLEEMDDDHDDEGEREFKEREGKSKLEKIQG